MIFFPEVEAPAAGVTPNLQHSLRTSKGKGLKRGRKAKKGGKSKRKSINKKSKTNAKEASIEEPKSKPSSSSIRSGSTGKRNLETLRKAKSPVKSPETAPHTTLPGDGQTDVAPAETKAKRKRTRTKAASSPSTGAKKSPTKPRAKAKAKAKAKARAKAPAKPKSNAVEPAAAGKVYQDRIQDGKRWRYKVLEGQVHGCSNCRFIYGGCAVCKKTTFRGKTAQQVWEEQVKAEQGAREANETPPSAENKPKKRAKRSKRGSNKEEAASK